MLYLKKINMINKIFFKFDNKSNLLLVTNKYANVWKTSKCSLRGCL